MWGMVQCAALEMDSRVLSLVCIDTDSVVGAKEAWRQVWHELVVSHWNAKSASASGDDDDGSNTVAEVEVCYRGKSRYVRRLCAGRSHIMGDTELVLSDRGRLENMSVSSFGGHTDDIPDGAVEVRVHAVSLNFKDVLNVLVPDESAYVGYETPPLPGGDFAGVVTAIPTESSPDEACPFSVGDKVYGLSFDMLRSKALVSTDSIAKMPCDLSFEEACTFPMVFLTVMYALKEQAVLKSSDRILIHSAAGGVGLAAIQYAQSIGAEIFATASPSKHDYLRSLGVKHISTSRDGETFVSEMSELVGDQGLDVVLSDSNLARESLDLLGPDVLICNYTMSNSYLDVLVRVHAKNAQTYILLSPYVLVPFLCLQCISFNQQKFFFNDANGVITSVMVQPR